MDRQAKPLPRVVRQMTREPLDTCRVRPNELTARHEGVIHRSEEHDRIVQVTLAITGVGLMRRRLENQCPECRGDTDGSRSTGHDLQSRVDRSTKCLSSTFDGDHLAPAEEFSNTRSSVIGHQHVHDIRPTRDKVDR